MHAFDEEEKLVKFANIYDLLKKFIEVRLAFYVKRKAYQLEQLKKEKTLKGPQKLKKLNCLSLIS